MPTSIITTEDLREFKEELLEDIKAMINHQSGFAPKKVVKISRSSRFIKHIFRHITKFKNQWNITIHKSWWCYLLRLRRNCKSFRG